METITLTEPREVVDLAVTAVGYHPAESLVAVGLLGNRPGPVLRADLTDLGHPANLTRLVALLTGHAEQVLLVAFTADIEAGARTARAVEAALGSGCPVVESLWATPTAYGSLTCTRAGCCPPEGRPLTELQSTALRATTVLGGKVLAGDRAGLLPPTPTPDAIREAEAAATAWTTAHPAGAGADRAGWAREALEVWAAARAGDPGPSGWGRLGAVLAVPTGRDLVTVHAATGGAGVDPATGAVDPDVLAGMFSTPAGVAPLRPAATTAAAAAALLQAAAHTTGPTAGHAYAAGAVVAWWSGDGIRAALAADAALDADPGNTLAPLIRCAQQAGCPPTWAAARPRP